MEALRALDLVESAPDPELDQVAKLAAGLFRVPVALITLTDESRNWFKARFGTDLCDAPRDISFCNWAVQGHGVFEVHDLAQDERFQDNPLVTGAMGVRYYAGSPIVVDGHAIGTLCLLDFVPRDPLDSAGRRQLAELGDLAVTLIKMHQLRRISAIAVAVADATTDAIVCFDEGGIVNQWNPAAAALFGYTARQAVGRSLDMLLPASLRPQMTANRIAYLQTGEERMIGRTVEIAVVHRDGHEIPVELSLSTYRESSGAVGFGAIVRDISARKETENARIAAQRFADHICANLPAALFVKDATTRKYLMFNHAGEELTGLPADAVVGRTDAEVWPEAAAGYDERDSKVIGTGVSDTCESTVVRPDGKMRIMRTKRVAVRDDAGKPLYLLGIGEDVTEVRRAQQQLAFVAGHDALTGLYNREHFTATVDVALAEHCPPGNRARGAPSTIDAQIAILAIDLDRFSSIVGAYGRNGADELLVDVAAHIRLAIKAGWCAARFDADRFFIMIAGAGAGRRAETLARELLASLAMRGGSDDGHRDRKPQARARIGIAIGPRDGDTAEALVCSAELASLRAKTSGQDATASGWRIAFFERAQDDAAKRRRRIEERLALAVSHAKIDVHYQPLIELADGRVSGFEALARWHDDELGEVSPVEFIPVAEAIGLIDQLGLDVLAKAARDAVHWPPDHILSVNFSAAQFDDDALAGHVSRVLAQEGLDPSRLEVEITESLLIAPHARVLDTLRDLKAMGATIAMDDFGTGYSSLSYFCSFPFDKVKIDQSFIRDMTTNREAHAIVRAVIGLAHGMGMKVVGEGVETQDQLDALRADGCDLAQGFLIGRPAAARFFEPPVQRSVAA